MARSRRSSPMRRSPARRSSPTRSRAIQAAPSKPAPAPAVVQQPQQQSGGIMSGLASTVAQGMAFGTGSAIAHRAVGAVADSFSGSDKEYPQENVAAPAPTPAENHGAACLRDQKAFLECLETKNNDIGACQFFYDAFQQCKQQAAYQV